MGKKITKQAGPFERDRVRIAQPREDFEALFLQGENGFSGSDGDLSIPIGKGRSMWLFGDTLIGPREDATKMVREMPRNALGILRKNGKGKLGFKFYWGDKKRGRYGSFFPDPRGGEWLWPGSACLWNKKLFFLLRRMRTRNYGGSEGFDFQYLGPSIHIASNPDAPPEDWRMEAHQPKLARSVMWCSACYAAKDGFMYVWGATRGNRRTGTVVARCAASDVEAGRTDRWEHWGEVDGSPGWTRKTAGLVSLFDEDPSEISVSYLPKQKVYVCVYGQFERGNVGIRLARSIMGPWSPFHVLYDPPELGWCDQYFCYAPKGHPEIDTGDDEFLMTYITNCHKIKYLVEDPRVYNPRCVSVPYSTIEKLAEGLEGGR